MGSQAGTLKYATSFDEKLLGVGCNVEVVVDIESGDAISTIEMRSFLRSAPAFRISLADLNSVLTAIKASKSNVKLLESMVDDAQDHQLNYACGGASLIVVQPIGKNARAVLTIGAFSREADLAQLSDKEVADAIARVETLQSKTVTKVIALRKK